MLMVHKYCFVLFSILLFLSRINSQNLQNSMRFYGPISNQITLHGRYYLLGQNVMYDWTCFKIDFCFKNTKQVVLNLNDSWNIYQVVIDTNSTKVVHPKKNKKIVIFQSTNYESHCIQIIKITENHYGPLGSRKDSAFNGIQINGGQLIRNQKKYDYKFDFLGDSLTTAFGVESGRNPICFLNMKNIQNCQQSWAVHLSNMFNADYRLQAVSGKGVVQNALGVPGAKMPSLYSRITDNTKQNSYKVQDQYVPDVLFLFIGANDYNNIKNPSIKQFERGYTEMLQQITKKYRAYSDKGTKIINMCDIQFYQDLCLNIKDAVKSFSYAYKHVYYVEIPKGTIGKKQTGCIFHPNVQGQKRIAEAAYQRVKDILSQ